MEAAWRAIARCLVWPALGAACGLLLLSKSLPAIGLGDLDRIRLLGQRLDVEVAASSRPAASSTVPITPRERPILLVGNSVTLEGLDAGLVGERLDRPVLNYAINGSRLEDTATLLPRLLETAPSAIVLSLMPTHLVATRPTSVDEAHAYRLAGFGVPPEAEHFYSREVLSAFAASPIQSLAHFRNAGSRSLDEYLRLSLASGRRYGTADDWFCPHILTADASEAALASHLHRVARVIEAGTAEERRRRLQLLDAMRDRCVDAEVPLVVCLAPVHPALREAAIRGEIDRAAIPTSVDLRSLLDADEFADAVHPNAGGRERFSRELSRQLAEEAGAVIATASRGGR